MPLNTVHFQRGNAMVPDQVRSIVWQAYLDVARLVRYYEALSDKYRRNHFMVRFLLLAAAASGIAALLELLPAIAQLFATALVALIVPWDFVSDYARKAAVLHAISIECSELESEWQELWTRVNEDEMSTVAVLHENNRLSRRILGVTSRAGVADIREDQKLNEKCAESAYRVMVERYAA